ncbi:MAG: hypothetical protein ISN28_11115 [Ectothiorhodospiraceae bacterium AqS1]|nr:hypothetical protein [Ectothiorhodospiraceae bacterium AqS1]
MDKSSKKIVIGICLAGAITIVACYGMLMAWNWNETGVVQDAQANISTSEPETQDVKVVDVAKEVHQEPTVDNIEAPEQDVKVVEVVKEVHHKPIINNIHNPTDVDVVEVVKEVHHKPTINNIERPAPDVKVVEVVKEVHHKPVIKTTKIDIPVSVQGMLDGNLDYILNNTCKFVSQSPAFIDSNKELAIECAQLWAMVTNARSE